ncbi:MAG: ElyC/SanA/YdcF family protein [Patescibacteria group bacterium]|nr:ElyC/SanA/YdcF family protein [Patescibacteria group bacterium]
MEDKPTVVINQIMGYGTILNDETGDYLEFCDGSMYDYLHPVRICGNEPDEPDPPKLHRIFSGGIPPGSSDPITEAEFMAQWFQKYGWSLNPDLDFQIKDSTTTRDNVLKAIPIIRKTIEDERKRGGIVRVNVHCDRLRGPRIHWLYEKHAGLDVRIYGFPFHRTKWEIFREFVSFHCVEKANYHFPWIAKILEPFRRFSLFRKFH